MNASPNLNAVIALAAAVREQANACITSALARRGITDLLPAHGAVLHALFSRNPLQMRALAEAIGRKKNTVTSLVNTLEERGYCRREPDPGDARVQLVFLTPKGESMREVQDAISEALLRRAWAGVDEAEKHICTRTLERVLGNLKRD